MYRMRLNGTEIEEYDWSLVNSIFSDVDGWSYGNSPNGLCRVNSSDGRDFEILTDDNANSVNAADGWVYYSNVSDNGAVYKIKTDGTEKTKLNDYSSGNINIAGDWIYYINLGDRGAVYSMKTDGSENGPVD